MFAALFGFSDVLHVGCLNGTRSELKIEKNNHLLTFAESWGFKICQFGMLNAQYFSYVQDVKCLSFNIQI